MTLSFVKSLWGFETEDPCLLLPRIVGAGFEGIEAPLFVDTLAYREAGLDYVAQAFCETPDALIQAVEEAHRFGAVLLNVQAGKDYWKESQVDCFMDACRPVATGSPCPVVFETHRGRIFHSAATAAATLMRHDWVRLCADFSHWTCVSESLLADQEAAVDLAILHSDYIHARVGHRQGAQVSSVREESEEFRCFMAWWHRILASSDHKKFRIDPEYGPPPYMIVEGDLWALCFDTMMALKREVGPR